MYSATVLEVLIASPSDTMAQREVIHRTVIDWNASNARAFGVVLLPVMWETHSIPGLEGRPQGMLNEQFVNDADILIATFWTRLGSPTGEADSGTVEEIARFRDNGRPAHVYFCDIPVAPLSTDTKQIEAIRGYRDELSKVGLFSSYASDEELRLRVRDDLTKRIHEMKQDGRIEQPSSVDTAHTANANQTKSAKGAIANLAQRLKGELGGYLAGWEAVYQAFDDYSVDARYDLMRQVAQTVLDTIRRLATIYPTSPVLPSLQQIVAEATGWSNFRIYLDGGATFNQLSKGCQDVLDEVRQVVAVEWTIPGAPDVAL